MARANPASLEVITEHGLYADGTYWTTIRLPTGDLPKSDKGLPVNEFEDVLVGLRPSPLTPPVVEVGHDRFVGHAHILQGRRLCVYLDSSREWAPSQGMTGFLEQLWTFFADAVAGKFDASLALYHPVGGVLHQSPGTPTVVVRDSLPTTDKNFGRAQIRERNAKRVDLMWERTAGHGALLASIVHLPVPLVYGAGGTLLDLLGAIGYAGHPQPQAVLRSFAATAARNPPGSPLYFVLAVPNKAGAHRHLLVGRLGAEVADELQQLGSLDEIDVARISPAIPIEWCAMSDERLEIATRRDVGRPVNSFAGRTVHVWGCGGLGSWIAEFVARAGVARIVVCDPGLVVGGLLVRQNYVEDSVGFNKAEALANRLRSIRDDLEVEAETGVAPQGLFLPECDVLIDATVNRALGELIDTAARELVGRRPLLAQVATDARSGTLGLLTVAAAEHPVGPATIDVAVGRRALADGVLERFHPLWQEPNPGDEIVPAKGCSTPTFHGSAADLASVAGSQVSLLGAHIGTGASGVHLVASIHAQGGPAHVFVDAST